MLTDYGCMLYLNPKIAPADPLGSENASHMTCVTQCLFKPVPWGFTALFLEGGASWVPTLFKDKIKCLWLCGCMCPSEMHWSSPGDHAGKG